MLLRRVIFIRIIRKLSNNRSHFPKPPLPETCCGSGCQDCVWIQYADAIHKYFEDYPQLKTPEKWNKVQNLLRHNIEDVNYRAYIEMEMKSKFFSKD